MKNVFITGGAGYVGAVLVPKLLNAGYHVKVLDLYIYGEHVLDSVKDHPNLKQVKGDIRDRQLLEKELPGSDAVIHLACISNDPSFELDPDLGKSINYDAFFDLVDVSKDSGVKRFVYASSQSMYGVANTDHELDEDDSKKNAITAYARTKWDAELALKELVRPDFAVVCFRPSTVFGVSLPLWTLIAFSGLAIYALAQPGLARIAESR